MLQIWSFRFVAASRKSSHRNSETPKANLWQVKT